MTQEQKDLLLQDLNARLPYGVKVAFLNEDLTHHSEPKILIGIECVNNLNYSKLEDEDGNTTIVEFIKPYLFPMSSMTEEQTEELRLEHEKDVKIMANCLKKCSEGDTSLRGKNILYHAVDWCNKNHFDYRGLIPMGLALDATGLNIY